MSDERTLYERIADGVKKYQGTNWNDPANFNELLKLRKHLSAMSYKLAEEAGTIFMDYKMSYFTRKKKEHVNAENYAESKMSVTRAKNKAKAEATPERKNESRLEGEYRACKLLLDQLNKVLDSASQQISHLRKEVDYENYTQTKKPAKL